MTSVVDKFDGAVNNAMSVFVQNDFLSTGLTMFLILYASMAAPRLPENIARMFDNVFVKFIILFLIAYNVKRNPTAALIASMGFMITILTINKYDINKKATSLINDIKLNFASNQEHQVISENSLSDIKSETIDSSVSGCSADSVCTTKKYTDSFYPQYSNMKPTAYIAKHNADKISAYDPKELPSNYQ